jgi:hypothetical protein
MIFLLLLLQQQAPTVGDTLWATRTVRLGAGDSVRAAEWTLEGPVQLLGRPIVIARGERAEIRYPLVAWEPGDHQLDVPGPIITRPSGVEDTLGSESITLRVASVLPQGVPESTLAVQPPATPVLLQGVSLFPAAILLVLAALLLVPLHWWWTRRGKPAPPRKPPPPFTPAPDMIEHWVEIGERRAVAGMAATRIRAAIARQVPSAHAGLDTESMLREVEQQRPMWPRKELAEVLKSLDTMRFAPIYGSTDVLQLYQRGVELAQALEGGGT